MECSANDVRGNGEDTGRAARPIRPCRHDRVRTSVEVTRRCFGVVVVLTGHNSQSSPAAEETFNDEIRRH